jgi:hypothetical protein
VDGDEADHPWRLAMVGSCLIGRLARHPAESGTSASSGHLY